MDMNMSDKCDKSANKIVSEKCGNREVCEVFEVCEKYISIAIDGPSGAGKSSLAKNLAEKLGYVYLDTGALYRAVGLYVCEKNIAGHETEKIEMCITADKADKPDKIDIELIYSGGVQKVFLNGDDVSEKIRENHISKYASDVSKINKVREFLLKIQRETADKNNVVMDGRDIGTVILPNADVKIFLTASPEKRAERRYKELLEKSKNRGCETDKNDKNDKNNEDNIDNIDYNKILNEINERDNQDSTREIAPLKPAEDAFILDNSDCDSPGVTLERALKIIKEALPYVSIR